MATLATASAVSAATVRDTALADGRGAAGPTLLAAIAPTLSLVALIAIVSLASDDVGGRTGSLTVQSALLLGLAVAFGVIMVPFAWVGLGRAWTRALLVVSIIVAGGLVEAAVGLFVVGASMSGPGGAGALAVVWIVAAIAIAVAAYRGTTRRLEEKRVARAVAPSNRGSAFDPKALPPSDDDEK